MHLVGIVQAHWWPRKRLGRLVGMVPEPTKFGSLQIGGTPPNLRPPILAGLINTQVENLTHKPRMFLDVILCRRNSTKYI